jgi:hypothetical protein
MLRIQPVVPGCARPDVADALLARQADRAEAFAEVRRSE